MLTKREDIVLLWSHLNDGNEKELVSEALLTGSIHTIK